MTGPRNVAVFASTLVLCAAIGCTNFYEIPIETPIQPKMDVTPFSRVLVAGFISGGSDDVDGNLETVRLLRSQLRSKSTLRVIEAEVLPLTEIARDQIKVAPAGAVTGAWTMAAAARRAVDPPTGTPAPSPLPEPAQTPATSTPPRARGRTGPADGAVRAGVESTDGKIRNEKDLERYQGIFENAAFWKKIGEEHQNPLIVTGTVLFTDTSHPASSPPTARSSTRSAAASSQPYRVYMERKGFIIEPRFIFIDGRTGAVLYSDRFHEEILYPAQQQTPPLSSYFELMDRLIPSFLGSLSTQRIRGTRVLLK